MKRRDRRRKVQHVEVDSNLVKAEAFVLRTFGGKNRPCRCQSGKLFKQCCYGEEVAKALQSEAERV